MTSLHKYKLLAFICALKKHRDNSTAYRNEKKYIISKAIGLSPQSYSKYLQDCIKLGLVVKSNWGNYHFLALSKAIEMLFDDLKGWKHKRFYQEFNHVKHKDFYEQIIASILIQNINQQSHQENKHNRTQLRKEIITGITGKNHYANLLGCSPSTGLRRLKTGHSKRLFKREVQIDKLDGILSHSVFDLHKKTNKNVFVSKYLQQFISVKGSLITL